MNKTKKWIAAGKLLSLDKEAIVVCPECNDGILIVKDQDIEGNDKLFNRFLICNKCGKYNVITMNKMN